MREGWIQPSVSKSFNGDIIGGGHVNTIIYNRTHTRFYRERCAEWELEAATLGVGGSRLGARIGGLDYQLTTAQINSMGPSIAQISFMSRRIS